MFSGNFVHGKHSSDNSYDSGQEEIFLPRLNEFEDDSRFYNDLIRKPVLRTLNYDSNRFEDIYHFCFSNYDPRMEEIIRKINLGLFDGFNLQEKSTHFKELIPYTCRVREIRKKLHVCNSQCAICGYCSWFERIYVENVQGRFHELCFYHFCIISGMPI